MRCFISRHAPLNNLLIVISLYINVSNTGCKMAWGWGTFFIHVTICMLSRVHEFYFNVILCCKIIKKSSCAGNVWFFDSPAVTSCKSYVPILCGILSFCSRHVALTLRTLFSLRKSSFVKISALNFLSICVRCYVLLCVCFRIRRGIGIQLFLYYF